MAKMTSERTGKDIIKLELVKLAMLEKVRC